MEVWMQVSKDKYQLPLAIADSIDDLAHIVGCKPKKIYDVVHRHPDSGKYGFVKVKI